MKQFQYLTAKQKLEILDAYISGPGVQFYRGQVWYDKWHAKDVQFLHDCIYRVRPKGILPEDLKPNTLYKVMLKDGTISVVSVTDDIKDETHYAIGQNYPRSNGGYIDHFIKEIK